MPSKTYTHSKKPTFKHEVIHIDNASELAKNMKKKAKEIGLPPNMPIVQLARIAIMEWLNS